MNLYEKKERFDPNTGKSIGTRKVPSHFVCDYCGRIIPNEMDEDFNDAWEGSLDLAYSITEQGGAEPMFHQIDLKFDGERVCPYSVFNNSPEFYYCRYWDGPVENCEQKMISEFQGSEGLCEMMYDARIAMLQSKFNDGTFNLEDFDLELS